jgi:hypothetical protein
VPSSCRRAKQQSPSWQLQRHRWCMTAYRGGSHGASGRHVVGRTARTPPRAAGYRSTSASTHRSSAAKAREDFTSAAAPRPSSALRSSMMPSAYAGGSARALAPRPTGTTAFSSRALAAPTQRLGSSSMPNTALGADESRHSCRLESSSHDVLEPLHVVAKSPPVSFISTLPNSSAAEDSSRVQRKSSGVRRDSCVSVQPARMERISWRVVKLGSSEHAMSKRQLVSKRANERSEHNNRIARLRQAIYGLPHTNGGIHVMLSYSYDEHLILAACCVCKRWLHLVQSDVALAALAKAARATVRHFQLTYAHVRQVEAMAGAL